MSPDHAHFAEWDAAYVLGALSSTERRQFEEHLAGCGECRRAIAELSPTVGLLSRVSADRAAGIDAELAEGAVAEGPDASVRDEVVVLARRRAIRRRRNWWVAAAAAVVVLIAAIAIPVTIVRSAPTAAFALEAVADVPLEASVRLSSVGWGTRIELECRYTARGDADAPAEGWPYALTVVGVDGVAQDVSTWRALPGSTARISAGSALGVADIGAIEIRGIESGRVLMRYELDGAVSP
ncbi:zf-HC2 domain-containing protein [Microbacterium sp.]|uniref:anti-sigma factor family protein n=1 Tax=Microbacterium sp. TaxID=51671 RepID=UPI002E341199|nr:zf-HC2 domain-containing protein [Microbacterium sp.]HEX5728843.1 zf-HC2 domain-containing protein [Microbacterium sp.]